MLKRIQKSVAAMFMLILPLQALPNTFSDLLCHPAPEHASAESGVSVESAHVLDARDVVVISDHGALDSAISADTCCHHVHWAVVQARRSGGSHPRHAAIASIEATPTSFIPEQPQRPPPLRPQATAQRVHALTSNGRSHALRSAVGLDIASTVKALRVQTARAG